MAVETKPGEQLMVKRSRENPILQMVCLTTFMTLRYYFASAKIALFFHLEQGEVAI